MADAAHQTTRARWCAEYRAAFIAHALTRGWDQQNAEAWAHAIVDEAAIAYWPDVSPADGARKDVPQCEWESANAC